MNEQLQQTINEILQKAIAATGDGVEFLKGQIPDVLQQLLAWSLCRDYMLMLVFALLIAVFPVWFRLTPKYDPDFTTIKTMSGSRICALMFGGFGSAICGIGFLFALFDAVQIHVAPKVWLLEYAAHLVDK